MKQTLKATAAIIGIVAACALAAAAVFALWWALWIFQPAIGVPM